MIVYILKNNKKRWQKSNCSEIFCRKGTFKTFAKFKKKKSVSDSIFHENTTGVIKKQFYQNENPIHVCSCKCCGSFKHPYFIQHLRAATSRET